jgi:hypothetical protein
MKNGGNKPLMDLLEVYGIDRKNIKREILYNSRLLDFYRKLVYFKLNKNKNIKF